MLVLFAGLLLTLGISLAVAPAANATAQTCITTTNGYVCTTVYGGGTHVDNVRITRGKSPAMVCNYSAWFFYIPPSGGAYGLGYQERAGCVPLRAWFVQSVNRDFPSGTLVCAKFFEDYNATLVGQKCVGVS